MMPYHRVVKSPLHKEPPPVSERYQIVDRADSPSPIDPKKLTEVLAKEGHSSCRSST
ncbi:MAG: hypothetical protein NVSMB14_12620 [Isosphaeraceae bacterium]